MSALERLREMVSVSGPRVVTAAHPAAAAAGCNTFAAGGNAFDAALAACFMETIVLPMKAGLFGDLVALFRTADGTWTTLVSVGAGPQALARGATLERVGPRSVGVPGAPHGYATLHTHASLDLAQLVRPAVHAAIAGVPWTRVARSYVVEAAETLARLSPNNPYMPGGRIPAIGEIRKLPKLGALLEAFSRDREKLWSGERGQRVIAELARRGGILTIEDLAQRPAQERAPMRAQVADGAFLIVTPEPTQGPRLIEVVREHCVSRQPLPALVRADRAAAQALGRLASDDGTSVVTAADDQGNAIVILHSNSFPQFASGIVLDSGLILNNRPGRGFDLTAPANAANAPKAGRVPPTTLHAWCLERGDRTLIGATPGGVNQLPWNAQTLSELIADLQPALAVTSPRWSLDASDVLGVEEGASIGDLRADKNLSPLSVRSAQQIIELSDVGLHTAAADPRSGCLALCSF